ncbi:uncharacterized protein LOC105183357 isoform X2 [Harpegnathos saltator]|uniref:O-acyltransferase WSD1 C-terminal domain-containing protein n=1 Tax=Harpegnathos saltator TaxID=610380 RepID=E2BIZ6_HARSA|nr:uncharacterized protein LOC105183357 isoform X2 [Harpegnathos saltator]EFN84341.1 hypothetical protein EAI_13834 [Harpegnathos saltator]
MQEQYIFLSFFLASAWPFLQRVVRSNSEYNRWADRSTNADVAAHAACKPAYITGQQRAAENCKKGATHFRPEVPLRSTKFRFLVSSAESYRVAKQVMIGFGISSMVNLGFSLALTILLVPLLIIAYLVKWTRKCRVRFVRWKYPSYVVVEHNSIRSILDQGRNHGIFTLLVQGRSIADGARNHLAHLASSRRLLRSNLFTRWGVYVWKELDYFSVDSHLVKSPGLFRGRPITESNIQDYVSDVTSKFLPARLPPWQVHVVNCLMNGEECQVCLVRVHHLLLRQEHLTLADFLPLKYSTDDWTCLESDSPFTNLYTAPSALPRLRQMLIESFSNYWNDFLYNNDPIERPEILKKRIGLFQCGKIAMIVLVCTLKELARQCRKTEGLRFPELLAIVRRESSKRNFSPRMVLDSVLKTFNPVDVFCSFVTWSWYIMITSLLKTPVLLLRELQALNSQRKHCHPETLTYTLWCYLPLMFQAMREAVSISWIAVTTPKVILEELFFKHPQSNRLQTISPCGRKVVAWSERVDVELVRKIANVTGATEAEILLTATVDALKEYFRHSTINIPNNVFATVKFVSQRAIFLRNHEARGILCLALPIRTPFFNDDLIEILQVIQKNVHDARSRQSAIYAITAAETSRGVISSCLPSVLLKLLLNQLTKRYSFCLTHVDGDLPVEGVDTAVYWRPPQGNCNMSMTLHKHGNAVRLGIMGDALIGPQHFIIARTFPKSVQNLATILGVPRTLSRSSSPSPLSPTTSPGY